MERNKKPIVVTAGKNRVTETSSGLLVEEFDNQVLANQADNIKAVFKLFTPKSADKKSSSATQKQVDHQS